MTKQAIVYCRFSPRPNAADDLSNDKQQGRCVAYCVAYNHEVAGIYRDDAISGKDSTTRPALQEALEHVCKIKGILIVYSIDRFARGVVDGCKGAERLRKAGAEFVSITEHVDTTTPAGRCFYSILLAFAQMERERIGERTKAAMLKYQAEGRVMSKRLPYGYKVDPTDATRMLPEPDEQRALKLMVDLADQGLGLREIARHLEAAGMFPRTDRKWHHTTIRRILQRECQLKAVP